MSKRSVTFEQNDHWQLLNKVTTGSIWTKWPLAAFEQSYHWQLLNKMTTSSFWTKWPLATFEQNDHWQLLNKITTCSFWTFLLWFVCTWLLTLHAMIQSLKEFISDLSIWILVFSTLNLHFSVNYKAFQSALAFLIF